MNIYQDGFTFRGIKKDYILVTSRRRSYWAPVKRNLLFIPGKAGALLSNTTTDVRIEEVDIEIMAESPLDLKKKSEELSEWLITETAEELIFDDENDRIYYAVVDGKFDPKEIGSKGYGTIRFICPDPYKYGPEQTVTAPPIVTGVADFEGKVSGSTVENPHISKRSSMNVLQTPSGSWAEENDARYNTLKTLNGAVTETAYTTSGNIAQQLFSFNLIEHVQRKYNVTIPGSTVLDKVNWLKRNVKKLTSNWHGRGSILVNNPIQKADFVGKVAGSAAENPHNFKTTIANSTKIATPTEQELEMGQIHIDSVQTLNNYPSIIARSTSGQIAQTIFSFNLVEHVQRKYNFIIPGATTADKVTWLKANVVKLTGNWWGKGSGPSGNRATLRVWYNNAWTDVAGVTSHTSATISKLYGSNTDVTGSIQSDGFVHWIAYAEASDGNTPSRIETDYIELEVEMKSGYKANVSWWNVVSSSWSTALVHSNSTISNITRTTAVPSVITDDGFAHFLAYADPSNGLAPSRIETDYINLEAEVKLPLEIINISNEGTAEADPIIELEVTRPVTFAMIQNQNNEYMMIGQPVSVEQAPIEPTTKILVDTCDTTVGWGAGSTLEDGDIVGTIVSSQGQFRASDYGTGSSWHGPATKKSLSSQLQDFNLQAWIEFNVNNVNEIGRIQIHMLDASNRIIGIIQFFDIFSNIRDKVGRATVGNASNLKYIVSDRGEKWGEQSFVGRLAFQRQGKRFSARFDRYDAARGVYFDGFYGEYIDEEGLYQAPLAQIQVHFGAFGTNLRPYMTVDKIQVLRLNSLQEHQIPYIAETGDIIKFDHSTGDIFINGESRMDLKDFGAEFFKLAKGENQFVFMPWDNFNLSLKYREKYL